MKYNFDELIDRTGTRSVKLDAIPAEYPKDTVSLWVADMDFAVAQPIQAALHRRVDQGVFGYTMYNDPELKSAVTNWFARRYQWTVDPKDLFLLSRHRPGHSRFGQCLEPTGGWDPDPAPRLFSLYQSS